MIEIAAAVVIGLVVIPIGVIVAITICAVMLAGLSRAIDAIRKG